VGERRARRKGRKEGKTPGSELMMRDKERSSLSSVAVTVCCVCGLVIMRRKDQPRRRRKQ
jgi:hypothetical protein